MGPKRLIVAAAALGVLGGTVVLADEEKATGVVAVRQATMKANGDHMTAIKAIITEYPNCWARSSSTRTRSRKPPSTRPPCSRRAATTARPGPCRRSGRTRRASRPRPRRPRAWPRSWPMPRRAATSRRRSPRSRPSARKVAAAATRRSARRTAEAGPSPGGIAGAGGAFSGAAGRMGRQFGPVGQGRAGLPYRRVHQLPHRQRRPAAGGRRSDRQPVRRRSTRPTSRRTRQPGSAAGARPTSSGPCTRASRPQGSPYYPAFPYTSFTQISDDDLKALKAYLDTLPPVNLASRPHELWFPFNQRWGMRLWQWAFFQPGRFQPDPARDAAGIAAPTW